MSTQGQPEDHKQNQETEVEAGAEQVTNAAEEIDADDQQEQSEVLSEREAELAQQVANLRQELQNERDKALRVAAEAENIRRRAAQEVEKARNFALEKFAGELLSVIDNLERALQNIDHDDAAQKNVAEGIEMTHKGFVHTIEKFGMEVVDPQGQPFNPQQHEAMGMQENAELPANTVLYVMQKGYTLNGRLLRPAMVMVSKAPE
ncbi:nucleotide exchange factor GrpE [Aliidiomarina haloalkalitolerans]|uniref:Protein GrpE n=1 Tax=Aliidiomarina haloalkalitolerans TaxID=859059 RepID=A0A432VZE0_9GAMM|nr:nucleotide exchange factor GrpE [Aliidiomarina haloalkalitolerans]RUO22032.1 nucleotide exchange factor GrpE [Aliidiomarina haloalkalitolerans]